MSSADANPEPRGGLLRIGEVAERTGTTPRTIRYYEEIGLLEAAEGREPGSHRTYAESDVERLAELLRLKSLLGVSLEGLKDLIEAEDTRAALRREWQEGVDDPIRRRQILEELNGFVTRQLDLVRSRRDEIADLESELVARRKRIRELQRDVASSPQKS